MTPTRRKLVVVGDEASGKTCLVTVFVNGPGSFPDDSDFMPTRVENPVVELKVDGVLVELALWDTAGQQTYDRLRPLTYADSHVVLICFSVDAPDSLKNVEEKWIPEVKHLSPGSPVLLIGCKNDLRRDRKALDELLQMGQVLVTPEQGTALAQKLGAAHYLECSAKYGEGINDVFEHAVKASLLNRVGRKRWCIII